MFVCICVYMYVYILFVYVCVYIYVYVWHWLVRDIYDFLLVRAGFAVMPISSLSELIAVTQKIHTSSSLSSSSSCSSSCSRASVNEDVSIGGGGVFGSGVVCVVMALFLPSHPLSNTGWYLYYIITYYTILYYTILYYYKTLHFTTILQTIVLVLGFVQK